MTMGNKMVLGKFLGKVVGANSFLSLHLKVTGIQLSF